MDASERVPNAIERIIIWLITVPEWVLSGPNTNTCQNLFWVGYLRVKNDKNDTRTYPVVTTLFCMFRTKKL